MVIARAKPVAIYDFPLFLILKLKSWIPDLKRRLITIKRHLTFSMSGEKVSCYA